MSTAWHVATVRGPGRSPAGPVLALPPVPLAPYRAVAGRQLTAVDVGTLLHRTAGLTRFLWRRTSETGSGVGPLDPPVGVTGRPVPSGGRCYPADLTVAVGDVAGIPAGVYRFDPYHHWLVRMRKEPVGAAPSDEPVGIRVTVTAVAERVTAFYGPFGRVLADLEAGALATQVLAAGAAAGLSGTVRLHRDAGSPAAVVTLGPGSAVGPSADCPASPGAVPGLLDSPAAIAAAIDRRSSTVLGYRRGPLAADRARTLLAALTTPGAPDCAPTLHIALRRAGGIDPWWTIGAGQCWPAKAPFAVETTSQGLRRECEEANVIAVAAVPPHRCAVADVHRVAVGMVLQRACLAAAATGLGSRLHCDFDTAAADRALGIVGSVALVTMGACHPDRTRPEYPL